MSGSEGDAELFSDPRRTFDDGPAAKAEHRKYLAEALVPTVPPEPDAAEELSRRLDAVIDATIDAVVEAIGARRPAGAPAPRQTGSFDGGARESVPLAPPSHDEWLAEVIRHRLADRGADF